MAEALRKQELPMYFMPKVSLLKNIGNYEEVIDMVDKIFHLSRNLSGVVDVVGKIAKLDLTATISDVYFKFMEWKRVKETRHSDVEDCLLTHLLQNDEAHSEDSQNDSEDINLDGYRFLFTIVLYLIDYTCVLFENVELS